MQLLDTLTPSLHSDKLLPPVTDEWNSSAPNVYVVVKPNAPSFKDGLALEASSSKVNAKTPDPTVNIFF